MSCPCKEHLHLKRTEVIGATGAQGSTGAQGAMGAQGETGAQGATGVQGETGSQGATGAQGETGPPGTAIGGGPTGAVQIITSPNGIGGSPDFVFSTSESPSLAVNSDGDQVLRVMNASHTSERLRITADTSRNLALGRKALEKNVASDNVALGTDSMLTNTTGASNVAVGNYALQLNTTGYGNVALGHQTMAANGVSSVGECFKLKRCTQDIGTNAVFPRTLHLVYICCAP